MISGTLRQNVCFSPADDERPTISCPANQTNATDPGVNNVTVSLPSQDSASDNSGDFPITVDVAGVIYSVGDTVTLDLSSGMTGVHLLQYIITDAAMNNDTCDMYITVIGR